MNIYTWLDIKIGDYDPFDLGVLAESKETAIEHAIEDVIERGITCAGVDSYFLEVEPYVQIISDSSWIHV